MIESSPADFASVETTFVLVGKVADGDVGPNAVAQAAAGLGLQTQHEVACYYLKVYVPLQTTYCAASEAEKQLIAKSNHATAARAFPD